MLISASRRTDIPSFYSDWFLNRARAGFLFVRNPRNPNQVSRVSLKPEDVNAIVFWTRNSGRIINKLDEIDDIGLKYYFQYTITGYPRKLEKSTPHPNVAIQTFSALSDKIGPGKVIWRYDPVILSNLLPVEEHKRLFEKIARMLEGKTQQVIIRFLDYYKKTQNNAKSI